MDCKSTTKRGCLKRIKHQMHVMLSGGETSVFQIKRFFDKLRMTSKSDF
jgi:hypothetical protein